MRRVELPWKLRATGTAALVILLGVAVGALVGMHRAEPIRQMEPTNPGAIVEMRTSFEDVRVYRVQDGDTRTVYVAVQGKGEVVAPQATWFTGKNGGVMEQALTVTRK